MNKVAAVLCFLTHFRYTLSKEIATTNRLVSNRSEIKRCQWKVASNERSSTNSTSWRTDATMNVLIYRRTLGLLILLDSPPLASVQILSWPSVYATKQYNGSSSFPRNVRARRTHPLDNKNTPCTLLEARMNYHYGWSDTNKRLWNLEEKA